MTFRLSLLAAVAAISTTVLLCSCGDTNEASPDGKYTAVASVAMISDVVKEIAGDKANVSGIINEGVDPHLYKPTSSDVKRLQAANIIFYNGLNLEGKMGDVLQRVADGGKPVTAVTETLLDSGDYVMNDHADHQDPHVWMDVSAWSQAAEVITAALQAYDPKNADYYADRSLAYRAELNRLHTYALSAFDSIPEKRRVLVTAHDAFGYMGRAYGLEVRGIQGFSTESEAGLRDINDLVDFLVKNEIPAVFVETSVAQKNIEALIEGARARGHDVRVGGELFSDAMGTSGTYEGTYIGMLDHNITTIVRALGGDAPEKGLNGKLSH